MYYLKKRIPVRAESGPRAISTLLWPLHEVTGLQLCPLFRDTQYPHLFVSDDFICVETEVLTNMQTFCTLQPFATVLGGQRV